MAELILPSLEVKLECYEGPLSVLLNLIRRKRISIWDIPISELVDRFLHYVEVVKEMNLRIAEDFIDIASLLIVLKSRMLLSCEERETLEEELLERVFAYENARRFASSLEELPLLYKDTFVRKGDSSNEEGEFDLYTLLRAFFELIKRKEERFIEIKPIKPTLEEKLSYLEERLTRKGIYIFDAGQDGDLSEKVATILSILEIVKRKVARIVQHRPFGRIILKRRDHL